jgi:pimeloyl-ACP methyl ester carboxylesterase
MRWSSGEVHEPERFPLPEIPEMLKTIQTPVLEIGYEEHGDADGVPVFLLHGFPFDVHAYREVAPSLASAGCRVLVPYLRGYGPTRFRSPGTLRSGQQAVLAHDLLDLMDALGVESAVLAGYDWGGRAACIVSALWPERSRGLVTVNGYNVHDIARSGEPQPPENEHRHWYQYYFHSERGRTGLERNREALCRLLWRLWSPNWDFDDATFERSATAFRNPDFVEVVIHSYRHRYGLVAGDPAVEPSERRLAAQPPIPVPAVVLDPEGDGVAPIGGCAHHRPRFTGTYEYRTVPVAGHNLPQEAPGAFARAVLALV